MLMMQLWKKIAFSQNDWYLTKKLCFHSKILFSKNLACLQMFSNFSGNFINFQYIGITLMNFWYFEQQKNFGKFYKFSINWHYINEFLIFWATKKILQIGLLGGQKNYKKKDDLSCISHTQLFQTWKKPYFGLESAVLDLLFSPNTFFICVFHFVHRVTEQGITTLCVTLTVTGITKSTRNFWRYVTICI
jgi:hypothetical protein